MDTYIIRIYRREENDTHTLAGTVEEPGIPGKKPFVNFGQLWDILNLKKKKLLKPALRGGLPQRDVVVCLEGYFACMSRSCVRGLDTYIVPMEHVFSLSCVGTVSSGTNL
jgi:hypothetical protein